MSLNSELKYPIVYFSSGYDRTAKKVRDGCFKLTENSDQHCFEYEEIGFFRKKRRFTLDGRLLLTEGYEIANQRSTCCWNRYKYIYKNCEFNGAKQNYVFNTFSIRKVKKTKFLEICIFEKQSNYVFYSNQEDAYLDSILNSRKSKQTPCKVADIELMAFSIYYLCCLLPTKG